MVLADMIDTWLFTALILMILTLCVILRATRPASPDDRLVAGTVAVILVSMTGLTLSIGLGMVLILDLAIVFAIIGFGVMIWTGKQPGAEQS
jgi:multisubunit Na+/H+ antiporter MnhF subunit